MARGDEQIREAERTALATGAVTDVARLHALLVAKGRPTYEVAQALGTQAQAVAAATEAELAALCACCGKGAIYQYTQDAYGPREDWVSCRHPQDVLERMGVLNARLLVQKKAVNLWAQALTVHPGQTAVYVNKRARAKYQNGAKAKVEVGTMGTVLETRVRYYGGSARRRSERSTTSALVCDGCGLMYWTNVTNLAVLDPLGAWLDHWRIMEEQDAETPDQAQERIQRGVFPYRATEGLWRRAPAPPAWTPARGQRVRFADGVEGEVFWVGGDRGGSLRVGVRVPGEQQPRWANAAEVLPVAANPCHAYTIPPPAGSLGVRHRHRTAIVQAHGHPDHRQRSVCVCGAYRLWVTLAVAPWRGRVAGPWHPADETSPPRPDGTPRVAP